MAEDSSTTTSSQSNPKLQQTQLHEEQSFENLGLDSRLIHALHQKNLRNPTPIQRATIPLILEGKDVVGRAKTGSGKTFAYLLPLLHKLFSSLGSGSGLGSGLGSGSGNRVGPSAFILVPSSELCKQVCSEIKSLIELCRVPLKVAWLSTSMPNSVLEETLSETPDVVISTPACLRKCLAAEVLQPKSVQESLSMLVLDEADLLLSYGYEDDLKALTVHIPRRCQCILMCATSSVDDVEKLKLILLNPDILTLLEKD